MPLRRRPSAVLPGPKNIFVTDRRYARDAGAHARAPRSSRWGRLPLVAIVLCTHTKTMSVCRTTGIIWFTERATPALSADKIGSVPTEPRAGPVVRRPTPSHAHTPVPEYYRLIIIIIIIVIIISVFPSSFFLSFFLSPFVRTATETTGGPPQCRVDRQCVRTRVYCDFLWQPSYSSDHTRPLESASPESSAAPHRTERSGHPDALCPRRPLSRPVIEVCIVSITRATIVFFFFL